MKNFQIKTIQDVKDFLKWCIFDQNLIYHPDNDFTDYKRGNGHPLFSTEDANYYDAVNDACIELCEKLGEDIYELGLEIAYRKEYEDCPDIKEEIKRHFRPKTDDMMVSQAKGITEYYCANAFKVENDFTTVKVYRGALDTVNVFENPIIDKFIIENPIVAPVNEGAQLFKIKIEGAGTKADIIASLNGIIADLEPHTDTQLVDEAGDFYEDETLTLYITDIEKFD